MAYDFNGTSHYMWTTHDGSSSASPLTSLPLTIACWFKVFTSSFPKSTSRVLLEFGNGTTGYRLVIPANQTFLRAVHFISAGAQPADTIASPSFPPDAWVFGAAIFASNASRSVFACYPFGGDLIVNQNTNTQSLGSATISRFSIGAASALTTNYFDGSVAEVGVWNAALNTQDLLSIGRGVAYSKVRPNSLVLYAPLIRNTNTLFYKQSLASLPYYIANTGASTTEHPRIYL
jgi:hypothetical protein